MSAFRRLLGRCASCWARSEFTCDVAAYDAHGAVVGKLKRLHYCRLHAQSIFGSLLSASEDVEVEYESGRRVTYRLPDSRD